MDSSLTVKYESDSLKIGLRNYFQLEASVKSGVTGIGKYTLLKNGEVIDTRVTKSGEYNFSLESYGNYVLIYDYVINGLKVRIKSESFKFDGFGADPNEVLNKRVAILGISRLALVVRDILKLSPKVEVSFVSTNPKHVGVGFGSEVVQNLNDVDAGGFDEWFLLNGVTEQVKVKLQTSGAKYDFVSNGAAGPVEAYLNLLPIGQIHALAHSYNLSNLNIGADFLVRHIRRRFGSVLPASVDLSGARFAYGCISTVINKNAIIGKNVTIGQNVTIGGRNGLDPKLDDGVWIGAGAVVLGAHIGANSTIGANAVVTKDLPPGSTVVAPRFRQL